MIECISSKDLTRQNTVTWLCPLGHHSVYRRESFTLLCQYAINSCMRRGIVICQVTNQVWQFLLFLWTYQKTYHFGALRVFLDFCICQQFDIFCGLFLPDILQSITHCYSELSILFYFLPCYNLLLMFTINKQILPEIFLNYILFSFG